MKNKKHIHENKNISVSISGWVIEYKLQKCELLGLNLKLIDLDL